MSIVTALEDIEDYLLIVKNGNGDIYFPSLSLNTIGNIVHGNGYQIYMTGSRTLTYPPNNSPRISMKSDKLIPKATFIIPEITRTGNNMTLIIEVDDILNGSEIGIWTSNNQLVGSGKVHNGISVISVWGDNLQTKIIDGATINDHLKAILFDKESALSYEITLVNTCSILSQENKEVLNYQAEDILHCKAIIENNISGSGLSLTCKPNPTTGEVTIDYKVPETSKVSLKLYSMTGQLIQVISVSEKTTGSYSIIFNGNNLSSGIYNLQLLVNGNSINRLLVITK